MTWKAVCLKPVHEVKKDICFYYYLLKVNGVAFVEDYCYHSRYDKPRDNVLNTALAIHLCREPLLHMVVVTMQLTHVVVVEDLVARLLNLNRMILVELCVAVVEDALTWCWMK